MAQQSEVSVPEDCAASSCSTQVLHKVAGGCRYHVQRRRHSRSPGNHACNSTSLERPLGLPTQPDPGCGWLSCPSGPSEQQGLPSPAAFPPHREPGTVLTQSTLDFAHMPRAKGRQTCGDVLDAFHTARSFLGNLQRAIFFCSARTSAARLLPGEAWQSHTV